MEKTGKIKFFDVQKGFGFITGDDGNDTFVHHSGITKGRHYTGLEQGDEVTYDITDGQKGPQAAEVVLVKKAERSPKTETKITE